MMPASFADHFSEIAARYAAYRPHDPPALGDALAERCTRHDLAWDAGCGNGQLSAAVAGRFAHVIAEDPSQAQIDAAVPHSRIEYRCASAEASTLADASADLAVSAQAAHWFDWPKFVAEVARVSRPGALVALVSYGILELDGDAAVVAEDYRRVVQPYWPPGREHVDNGYRDLVWPWPAVEAPAIAMAERWTRDELIGYATTWSATVKMVRTVGAAALDAFATRLVEVWPDNEPREIRWPLALRFARR
jgi:SAM-dependent methyltransferase